MEKVPLVHAPPRAQGEQDHNHQQDGEALGARHRSAAPVARAVPGGALVPIQSPLVRRRGPGGAPGAGAHRHGAVRPLLPTSPHSWRRTKSPHLCVPT
jgi:hypothetical protein